MIFLGLLCLVGCVMAQPTVYVARTTYEDPYLYYYPMDASGLEILPEKEIAEEKEIIISPIPEAPKLLPMTVILEPSDGEVEIKVTEDLLKANKEEELEEEIKVEDVKAEEFKEEEVKEEAAKDEEAIDEPIKEEVEKKEPKPVIVRLKPPQFWTDLIGSLPASWQEYPLIGSLFGKPKFEPFMTTLPGSAPVEMVRYRVAYMPIMKDPLELAEK